MEDEASSTLDSCSDSFTNDGVLRKEISKVSLKVDTNFFSFLLFKIMEIFIVKR